MQKHCFARQSVRGGASSGSHITGEGKQRLFCADNLSGKQKGKPVGWPCHFQPGLVCGSLQIYWPNVDPR